ncbi:MAG TPA: hypothetical protein VFI90_12550 [Rubrobacter sp.]|nr:hypothetical protein [Rubrobacter sp.]
MEERRVTCALELDGMFLVFENVPARVHEESGEPFVFEVGASHD